jgi:hypothetical protein
MIYGLGRGFDIFGVSCIEFYSSCKVWEVRKLGCNEWWVVRGIYSPNHQTSRLVKDAVAWRTGQSGAPSGSALTLARTLAHLMPSAGDRWREVAVAPLAHRTVRCPTGHCLVLHRTVR